MKISWRAQAGQTVAEKRRKREREGEREESEKGRGRKAMKEMMQAAQSLNLF